MGHEKAILEEAAALGREAGINAAGWWEQDAIGGRAYPSGETTRDVAQRILQGIEDGDPAILDSLPCPNLSGEYADDPTPRTLAEDLGLDDLMGEADLIDDACTTWEDAASEAVLDEIARLCREHLA